MNSEYLDIFNEKFQHALIQHDLKFPRSGAIKGAISHPRDFPLDWNKEAPDWLYKAAKEGIVGHYFFLDLSNNMFPTHIFYEKGNQNWTPCPMLITVDKQKIPVEFGKIRKHIDTVDLQKAGILQGGTADTEQELEKVCTFIKSWITKSTDEFLARKTLRTLFRRGIVISPPVYLAEHSSFSYHNVTRKLLNVLWRDFICPRCEEHFRVIDSDSALTTCPKCKTKFGTKS